MPGGIGFKYCDVHGMARVAALTSTWPTLPPIVDAIARPWSLEETALHRGIVRGTPPMGARKRVAQQEGPFRDEHNGLVRSQSPRPNS